MTWKKNFSAKKLMTVQNMGLFKKRSQNIGDFFKTFFNFPVVLSGRNCYNKENLDALGASERRIK